MLFKIGRQEEVGFLFSKEVILPGFQINQLCLHIVSVKMIAIKMTGVKSVRELISDPHPIPTTHSKIPVYVSTETGPT